MQKKSRNQLRHKEILELCKDYEFMKNKEIQEKYNISESYFATIRRDYKLGSRGVGYLIKDKRKIKDLKSSEVICGVYAIYRNDSRKMYIGSSIDIIARLKIHISQLSCNSHINIELNNDYDNYGWSFFVLKECEESELIHEENKLINSLSSGVLYNKNKYNNQDLNYLEIMESIKDKIKIDEITGCWNWTGKLKNGYGSCRNSNKDLFVHRVFYIAYNKTYPYIVNHKCENKKCCNPEHLEETSNAGNSRYSSLNRKYVEESKLWPYRDIIDQARKKGISYTKIQSLINIKCSDTNIRLFYKKYLDYMRPEEGVT